MDLFHFVFCSTKMVTIMKPKYILMLAVTVTWFVVAITLIILFNLYGEDWVNRLYMTTFLVFGGGAVVLCGQNLMKNRKDLFRKK